MIDMRKTTSASFILLAAILLGAPSANAENSRTGGEDGPGTATISPYAVPIDALGGITMAQYIQNHQAGDPHTTATV
ncbi:MAG: hypothetical protein ABIU87_02960 [Ornithinibacter sp.]